MKALFLYYTGQSPPKTSVSSHIIFPTNVYVELSKTEQSKIGLQIFVINNVINGRKVGNGGW